MQRASRPCKVLAGAMLVAVALGLAPGASCAQGAMGDAARQWERRSAEAQRSKHARDEQRLRMEQARAHAQMPSTMYASTPDPSPPPHPFPLDVSLKGAPERAAPPARVSARSGARQGHRIALFPAAVRWDEKGYQGFARVINRSDAAGDVHIEAFDDAGVSHGPATLAIDSGETVHFNSEDLERGNAGKGLSGGTGAGTGDWRLELTSTIDIEVLVYIRTDDGFLTSMHDLAPRTAAAHRVVVFNPGSNTNQVSWLRVVNPGAKNARVTIEGTDDKGESPGGGVEFTLPVGRSRTLSAQELESGEGRGLRGELGDGAGKWRLAVTASQPVEVMSLLSSPTGHLTNLSTVPESGAGVAHRVALFPAAARWLQKGYQGFARVINRSYAAGDVHIEAFDDAGVSHGPATLAIDSGETVHFNSEDLERGNAGKGLSGGTGAGTGDWRLELTSTIDIEVLVYIRTDDGFLTSMHDLAPRTAAAHRVVVFNPGSNTNQVSWLRVVNPGAKNARVTIEGTDDKGESPGGGVEFTLPVGRSRTLSAQELESGEGRGLRGELGDGAGKWRLAVTASQPVEVMSLLSSPTGHLTNLSTVPSEPRLERLIEWRDNASAENILDHWNHPAALREAMELSELRGADAVARRDAFERLSEKLEGGPNETGALLRNVSPEAIEVIGQRGGIAYGQWKGGPAGTLHIEFDWRFAQEIQNDVRAQFERAAKVWARRIEDDFRTYTIPKGRTFSFSEGSIGGSDRGTVTFTFDEDATTNGLLIPVVATDKTPWAALGFDVDNFESDVENTEEDFQPSLAVMFVNPDNPDLRGRWADTAAHEIGHALGITAVRDDQATVKNLSWLRNLDLTDHTFDGPRARGANGGRPVPLQWLAPGRIAVPPESPGAERDPGHLGVCNSIVSYVCNLPEVLIPTELDFAVLDDIGYEILDRETASEPELYGYAAWGHYSAWGASVERNLQYNKRDANDLVQNPDFGDPYRGYEFAADVLRAGVDAFGITPNAVFGESPSSPGQGTAVWSGTLIGVDLGREGLPPVFGDATISVDLSTLEGTVQIKDLSIAVDGWSTAFRTRDLQYEISVTGNTFADGGGRVVGELFGPGHEEMGATLHDARLRVNLLAVLVVSAEPISP